VCRILEDAEQWLKGHQEHTKEFFNDEWKYAGANRELTTIPQMAIAKFTHWLDGDGRCAVSLLCVVNFEFRVLGVKLRHWLALHRQRWEAHILRFSNVRVVLYQGS
jgi:hypothetical protein